MSKRCDYCGRFCGRYGRGIFDPDTLDLTIACPDCVVAGYDYQWSEGFTLGLTEAHIKLLKEWITKRQKRVNSETSD